MFLFDEGKPFFKGNLHCHSTRSDGRLSPEAVKTFYREHGYDFLALTDHRVQSEQPYMENGMLLLTGTEIDFSLPTEAVHIVGIGMREGFPCRKYLFSDPQTCVDGIREYDGRAILCHPAWSLNSSETIAALRDLSAVEIYNSTSTYPWNADRADSSVLLDIAATQGSINNFVASDDSHAYNGEAGRSATMIQADSLTQKDLLKSMDEGKFYCTQGPRFYQISVEDGVVSVNCSPVRYILFISNLVWSDDRCTAGEDLTSASYRLFEQPNERFVRVQLIDAQGNSAWSNPIKL